VIGNRILICVLTYNSAQETLACVASLKALREDPIDIVVIDNGSTDDTERHIRNAYSDITYVKNAVNSGAAGGRNIGLARVLKGGWDYVFFVDNDAVVDPEALGELIRCADEDRSLAAVGAITYYAGEKTKIWNFGGRIDWLRGRFYDGCQGADDAGQFADVKECDSFPIGFGIVRTEAIRKVGLLDERYFIYHEEADWHARMKRAGYRLAVTPRAKIYHKVSQSIGMETPAFHYYRTRNRLLFMQKNAPRLALAGFCFFFLYDFLFNTMLTLYLNGKRPHMRAALRGVADFLRRRFGKCAYESF